MITTKEKRDNVKFYMQVVVLPVLGLLIASEGYQYIAAPDKIKAETEIHVDNIAVNKLDRKLDSIARVLISQEHAKNVLEDATAEIKGLEGTAAKIYLGKVFGVADEAIKNDSNWRYVQRPYIEWLIENETFLKQIFKYQYLVPMRNRENNNLEFNWIDGVYPITERHSANGSILRRWRDRQEDLHHIQSISNIKDQ